MGFFLNNNIASCSYGLFPVPAFLLLVTIIYPKLEQKITVEKLGQGNSICIYIKLGSVNTWSLKTPREHDAQKTYFFNMLLTGVEAILVMSY